MTPKMGPGSGRFMPNRLFVKRVPRRARRIPAAFALTELLLADLRQTVRYPRPGAGQALGAGGRGRPQPQRRRICLRHGTSFLDRYPGELPQRGLRIRLRRWTLRKPWLAVPRPEARRQPGSHPDHQSQRPTRLVLDAGPHLRQCQRQPAGTTVIIAFLSLQSSCRDGPGKL